MKRLLVAGLCVAGLLLIPVASASAGEVVGTCAIKGTAEFGGGHLAKTPNEAGGSHVYSFNGTGTCVGSINGGPEKEAVAVSAHVEGEGNLSCVHSESSPPGKGYLEVRGEKDTFSEFTFQGLGANVTFVVGGNNSNATGSAVFVEGLAECLNPTVGGPTSVGFTASTSGKVG
jgi:hypothetical protein